MTKNFVAAVAFVLAFNLGIVYAKGGNEQDQIVLLNDSAAVLEDSNPELSKSLTKFADEKEKEWESSNANKNEPPEPFTDKEMQEHIKILTAAAIAIQSSYPLIAKGLNHMAQDINKVTENDR